MHVSYKSVVQLHHHNLRVNLVVLHLKFLFSLQVSLDKKLLAEPFLFPLSSVGIYGNFGVDMKSNAWIFVNRQIAKNSQIIISVVKQTSFECMPKLSIPYTA